MRVYAGWLQPSWQNHGLGEINGDLPEEDFWPASLRVCPGHNFLFARDPPRIDVWLAFMGAASCGAALKGIGAGKAKTR